MMMNVVLRGAANKLCLAPPVAGGGADLRAAGGALAFGAFLGAAAAKFVCKTEISEISQTNVRNFLERRAVKATSLQTDWR